MADVFQFPTGLVRDWAHWESAIHDLLSTEGASPEMVAEVVGRMREAHSTYYKFRMEKVITLELPGSLTQQERDGIGTTVEGAFDEVATLMRNFGNQVMLDRLRLEMQLYIVTNGAT